MQLCDAKIALDKIKVARYKSRMSATRTRPTLLAFNSVQRLLRGDFFHAVTRSDIRVALAEFPSDWVVTGLGTTNWFERNGELIIDGSSSEPRFLWADPLAEEPCAVRDLERATLSGRLTSPSFADLDGVPSFPFAAAAVCGPEVPSETCCLREGDDLHAAIGKACAAANIGLAALRVTGPMRTVEYQSTRCIPLDGVASQHPLTPVVRNCDGLEWTAGGFYSQNPTIQSLLGMEGADVHLHGHTDAAKTGGHLNRAIAARGAEISLVPLQDLLLRIHGLDVATLPVRDVA
jgi:hypothetical protein